MKKASNASSAPAKVPVTVYAGEGGTECLYTLGLKMVPPRRKTADLARDFNTVDYLSDIRVTGDYDYLGNALREVKDIWRLDIDVIFLYVGHLGPRAVLSGYFMLTMLLTAMISNQATAAILASLAIETAAGLGVHARPFLMAITFAASLSLVTHPGVIKPTP